MLSVEEARSRILDGIGAAPVEWVMLPEALDRVLARDLEARRTQPPSAVSAMDGYAVRGQDTAAVGGWLELIGESRAGGAPAPALGPGQAVRIFTGAAMPAGADAVAIQELATAEPGRVSFARSIAAGTFVRAAGLDFAAGWRGLGAGTLLDPPALGLAASMGHAWLPVRRRPRVAILATGDELCRPGDSPAPHQIISNNSTVLGLMIRRWGGQPIDLGIAADEAPAMGRALADARGADLLLTTGGASVGEYDLVRSGLGAEGLELGFWKIAMRPGKPLMFGRLPDATPFLGLPGNPVSAAVCAIVFVRAALCRMLGLDPALPLERGRITSGLPANDEREDYLRGRLRGREDGLGLLEPAARQDSSMFATFAQADALIVRAPHAPAAAAGASVSFLPIDRALHLPRR
jgi:molybdopterin molybdotransferase